MKPEDDPTWPDCTGQPACRPGTDWCEHIRQYLLKNQDAGSIEPGLRYCVPVYPMYDIWAEVSVGPELAPGLWQLALIKSVAFTGEEEVIDLGLLTKGEGRMSISDVIHDTAAGWEPKRCESSTHGFKEEQQLAQIKQLINEMKVNHWHIHMDGMCIACFQGFRSTLSSMNGSAFGLDQVESSTTSVRSTNTTGPVPSSGSTYGNQALLNKLRERYR